MMRPFADGSQIWSKGARGKVYGMDIAGTGA